MSGRLRDEVEYYTIDEEQEEDRSFYYGGASVPFIWESRPGTPKHNLYSHSSLPPPLTPPPSYYSTLSTPKRQSKVKTKLTQFLSLSLFNDLKKSSKNTTNNAYGSSFSWSSTSSSSSISSSPPHSLTKPVCRNKKTLAKYEEDVLNSSPNSTLLLRWWKKRV